MPFPGIPVRIDQPERGDEHLDGLCADCPGWDQTPALRLLARRSIIMKAVSIEKWVVMER